MKKIITEDQNQQIEAKILQFEERTGCELVVAIAASSDPYPAVALRFSVIATLVISLIATEFWDFHFDLILIVGQIVLILLLLPFGNLTNIKKYLLLDREVDREVDEKALELFFKFCTNKTEHKVSTLLYFSLLERRLRLLVDQDLNQKLSQQEMDEIASTLTLEIKDKKFSDGVIHAIATIEEKILKNFNGRVNQLTPNEIKNKIHWL